MRTKKAKFTPVGVIGKVLSLLELLDRAPGGLQLKDVAERTGINKSTAYRFLSHLEGEGYLFRDIAGNYMVGPKLTRMGQGASSQATLSKICRPVLENLRKITCETINLAVLDGSDILYIDVLETFHTFRLVSEVGMRRPFYSTALGKAILANMEDTAGREELCSSIHFERTTPHTITSVAKLKKQFAMIQKQGFSLDDEEAVIGVRCLGAAFLGADGQVAGGISISGPVVRITNDRLTAFSKEICKAAREISWNLGNRASPLNIKHKKSSK
jgi:DNA-binding IclR family transcriptional regulator